MNRCQMIGTICYKAITKTAIFTNSFGKEQRLGLCGEHAKEFSDPAVQKRLHYRALASWERMNPAISAQELLDHPAQKALKAHQAVCQACADVRDWVVMESQKGINSPEDVMRIGLYVVTHCCPVGRGLNEAVGRVMQGG